MQLSEIDELIRQFLFAMGDLKLAFFGVLLMLFGILIIIAEPDASSISGFFIAVGIIAIVWNMRQLK